MKNVLVQIGVDEDGGCHKKCYGPQGAGDLSDAPCLSAANVPDSDICHDAAARYHTPHSTRHTFSRLCESYEVKEADRKRMMGHSLKGDLTNGVYGHRSVKELKREIEKIEQ